MAGGLARLVAGCLVAAGALALAPTVAPAKSVSEAGTVMGVVTWCVPPLNSPTTTILAGGQGGSIAPPVTDIRILLLPAPASVTLERGGVVVARQRITYRFEARDPSSALPYNGAVVVMGRFHLRAAAGAYVLTTPEVTRRVAVRAGQVTWVRATLTSC